MQPHGVKVAFLQRGEGVSDDRVDRARLPGRRREGCRAAGGRSRRAHDLLHLDVPGPAVAVRKAAALGETEPSGCRGRSTWPAQGQVAELAVRRETGLRDADLLTVEGTRVHARDGRAWDVEVAEVTGAPRPSSCGAAALPTTSWQARAIHPVV
jgi:hypothetical protein